MNGDLTMDNTEKEDNTFSVAFKESTGHTGIRRRKIKKTDVIILLSPIFLILFLEIFSVLDNKEQDMLLMAIFVILIVFILNIRVFYRKDKKRS